MAWLPVTLSLFFHGGQIFLLVRWPLPAARYGIGGSPGEWTRPLLCFPFLPPLLGCSVAVWNKVSSSTNEVSHKVEGAGAPQTCVGQSYHKHL